MQIKAVRKWRGYQRKNGYYWLLEVDGEPQYRGAEKIATLEWGTYGYDLVEYPGWTFDVLYPYVMITDKLGIRELQEWRDGEMTEQEALEKAIKICEKLVKNYRGEKHE